jgi:hypothetical protein
MNTYVAEFLHLTGPWCKFSRGGVATLHPFMGAAGPPSRSMGASAVLPSVTWEAFAFFFLGEQRMVAAEGATLVGFAAAGNGRSECTAWTISK